MGESVMNFTATRQENNSLTHHYILESQPGNTCSKSTTKKLAEKLV